MLLIVRRYYALFGWPRIAERRDVNKSNYHWIYVVVNSAIRKPAQIIDIKLEILFREWVLKDRSRSAQQQLTRSI